ncbi:MULTISPECIES: hypothetical protein [Nonomuraea]|jgi:hypothetical protein|uniref:Uncharacterized protein n=3 Tax=Nonomuraea TaxID=83681 RepID=A0A7W5YRM7_9ACTN|nr:hypothetical protein [Nonomuraea dietziae]MBB3731107.1 hypothetical protein [Nonomuraea dietziae]
MHDDDYRPEEHSSSGKPMVPSTPRDVVHIRAGSFILVFLFAIGAISIIAGIGWLAIVAGVLVVATIVDIVLAVRRQKERGAGEAG